MDKYPPHEAPEASPSRQAPDYFSLVIEWDVAPATAEDSSAPRELMDNEPTAKRAQRWDAVDQASADSFPASDPPAWGSAHAAPSYATATQTAAPVNEAPRWHQPVRRIAIALAAIGTLFGFVLQVRRRSHAHAH